MACLPLCRDFFLLPDVLEQSLHHPCWCCRVCIGDLRGNVVWSGSFSNFDFRASMSGGCSPGFPVRRRLKCSFQRSSWSTGLGWVFPHLVVHEHACQRWIFSPIVSWWSHTVSLCCSWSLLPLRLTQAHLYCFFCLGGCFFWLPSVVLCFPSGLPVSVPLSWLEEVGSWWSCVPLSLQWCLFACCMIWCSNLFPLGIYRVLVLVC